MMLGVSWPHLHCAVDDRPENKLRGRHRESMLRRREPPAMQVSMRRNGMKAFSVRIALLSFGVLMVRKCMNDARENPGYQLWELAGMPKERGKAVPAGSRVRN